MGYQEHSENSSHVKSGESDNDEKAFSGEKIFGKKIEKVFQNK